MLETLVCSRLDNVKILQLLPPLRSRVKCRKTKPQATYLLQVKCADIKNIAKVELPREVSDVIEVSNMNLEFANKNREYAVFEPKMDTLLITRQGSFGLFTAGVLQIECQPWSYKGLHSFQSLIWNGLYFFYQMWFPLDIEVLLLSHIHCLCLR